MIKIRTGVFETNSSSVHSISVVKMRTKGDWESYLEDGYQKGATDEKKIVFRPKCYGWEFALLSDVSEKASYLASVAYHLISSEIPDGESQTRADDEYKAYLDRFVKQAKKWLDEDNLAYRFVKPKVSKWSSGCEYVEAWVDHGGEAKEFYDYVMSSKENFLGFLFMPNSIVWTGNDNSAVIPCLEESKIRWYDDDDIKIFEKGN